VTSSILNVTFECLNAASLAQFWSEITGSPYQRVDMPGNPFWVVESVDATGICLVFVTVSEEKKVKNRLHLDLVPLNDTQAEELTRFESLGARVVDDRRNLEPGGWVVMEDPEGNEFCLERGDR
jgi:predicted enzyme related to lactoylglutathione lyase